MKIATYGSLRVGGYNYRPQMGEPLWKGKLSIPFKLKAVCSYPAIVADEKEHDIVIEVFDIPESTFIGIDRMERGAGYYSKIIETPVGPATIWFWERDNYDRPEIEDGDYIRWYKEVYK